MSGVTFAGTQNDGFQWNIGSGRYRSEYMEKAKALREKYGRTADMDPGFQREMEKLRQQYASNPAAGYHDSGFGSNKPVNKEPSVFMNGQTNEVNNTQIQSNSTFNIPSKTSTIKFDS